MSLADMTITPVSSAPAASKPAAPSSMVRGTAAVPGVLSFKEGRFSAADGSDAAPIIKREGGSSGAPEPKNASEILKKFGATWAQDPAAPPPAAETGAKPAETLPAAATPPAEGAAPATAAPAAEPGKDAAKPAEPFVPGLDELRALFGERKPAEIKAEIDRVTEANRRLVAEAEAARKRPAAPAADDGPTYIDDSIGWIRRSVARELGLPPDHADVDAEVDALTLDLNAKKFGVPLDDAQQAKRDAAKARQALARDSRTRKAQSESSTSSEETATKQATAFIGNRLVAPRTGPDGKPQPSIREQLPLAAAMAQRPGAKPLEEQILDVYRRELATGRFDPQRLHDDDYLIAEAGKLLESHYQDLADALGKARTPSTAPTPQPTTPATAPAATASASSGPPQGHGGRTALTAADSSVPPPTPPPTPAPKPAKKLQTREEFFSKWYPKS